MAFFENSFHSFSYHVIKREIKHNIIKKIFRGFNRVDQDNNQYLHHDMKTFNGRMYQQMQQVSEEEAEQIQAQMQQQLQILDQSYQYTTNIIIGILLQQLIIKNQKCILLGETTERLNYFPIRLTSNLLVFCALSYFSNLAHQTACAQESSEGQSSNQFNVIASDLVLYGSIFRLLDLFCGGGASGL